MGSRWVSFWFFRLFCMDSFLLGMGKVSLILGLLNLMVWRVVGLGMLFKKIVLVRCFVIKSLCLVFIWLVRVVLENLLWNILVGFLKKLLIGG